MQKNYFARQHKDRFRNLVNIVSEVNELFSWVPNDTTIFIQCDAYSCDGAV